MTLPSPPYRQGVSMVKETTENQQVSDEGEASANDPRGPMEVISQTADRWLAETGHLYCGKHPSRHKPRAMIGLGISAVSQEYC